jgi:glycerol-3-phosphate dehydrogenase
LARADVVAVMGGMLPETPRPGSDEVQLVKHSWVRDHSPDGAEGLVSVVGVKWTTARAAGEEAVDTVEARLRPGAPRRHAPERPVRGGEIADLERFFRVEEANRPASVSPTAMRHLLTNYGTATREVLACVSSDPSLGRELSDASPVIGAEVVFGVEQEMARQLSDVVLRRTELAIGGHPGREVLARCVGLMAPRLGWSASRGDAELDRTDSALRGLAAVPSR